MKIKFDELIRLYGGPKDSYYILSCSSEPDQEATQVIFWLDFWPRDMNKKLDVKKQQISLNSLSDTKSDVKVLLASIKACSDGISLIGASRVVLLDVFWNPTVEQQAVSGAYRNGQKKIVRVYCPVISTWEVDKIEQQMRRCILGIRVSTFFNAFHTRLCSFRAVCPWSRTGKPGHTARNEQSLVLKDLKKVDTEMDILLPGTPFQNNIKELYHTLLSSEELRDMISPWAHKHSENVKKVSLPDIRDTVIHLKPTDLKNATKSYPKTVAKTDDVRVGRVTNTDAKPMHSETSIYGSSVSKNRWTESVYTKGHPSVSKNRRTGNQLLLEFQGEDEVSTSDIPLMTYDPNSLLTNKSVPYLRDMIWYAPSVWKQLLTEMRGAITMEPAAASVILAKLEAITHQWEVINKRLDHMGFLREQVGCPDTRQDEDHSSCEIRGKNVIPYNPMNVVAVLPSVGVHESSFYGTLGIVRSYEDQTLVVGTQALVDPLDDEIDSPGENDLCPSSASTYNLTKVPLPSNESIQTLVDPCEKQDESTLVCELITTSEGEQNDQPGVDDLDLLKCLENPSCDCPCEDDFDCGPLAFRDGFYVCED
ncbi:hypothetical protein CQW23_08439 [Capsicum baccatum]|uniref:Helicase C-terminal domain-containing protein n=1 Tax=Capsicum baccatum TaxID=33114 RepID=A0A2G2X936_CAPBA|nr:hypothetical protein CQW23_08439 [Capsicum baccatum]